MINDQPHWYTTEYLNKFNIQLLTESDKSEAEEDTVIFHGPFKTVEEAIEFEKEVPYCTWTWEEEGAWNTLCIHQFVVNNSPPFRERYGLLLLLRTKAKGSPPGVWRRVV
jgi:hypothetical protein